jgi:TRAP-type uncharacterized transport system substrate-binding protein
MSRRTTLVLIAGIFASCLAKAHTPYKQWVVYRKKHLLIGTDKSIEGSYPLGEQLASVLAAYLPESRARAARAPNSERIASLLATGQLDIALLPRKQAVALTDGEPPFTDYGPIELHALYVIGDFILVCRADFPEQHAYLVTETLVQNISKTTAISIEPEIPLHPGSKNYFLDH